LIQGSFVDVIVEWDSRQTSEECRFTAIIMREMSNNPRNIAIAQSLCYLNMGQAGREIERHMSLNSRFCVLTSRFGWH
jgi:hypothetical protein